MTGIRWARRLDQLGVTIVHANGNDALDSETGKSRDFMNEVMPCAATNAQSPVIAVGGVYRDGGIWPRSMPSGSSSVDAASVAEVTVYAQAAGLRCVGLAPGPLRRATGNSYAAPQVVRFLCSKVVFPTTTDPLTLTHTAGWPRCLPSRVSLAPRTEPVRSHP